MSSLRFENKVVAITGGASGIGLGWVEIFHREGGRIALLDRNQSAGEQIVAGLNESVPNSACFFHCDVSDSQMLVNAISSAASRWSRLDCLINNAGIHPPDTAICATTDAMLESVFKVNFTSTFVASRTALPFLASHQGTIINMSSMTAVLGQRNSTAYAASKGAQLSLTKSLALEAAETGVRVNAVLPGNVDTPLMRSWAETLPDPDAALARIAGLQPLGRMAAPEEIGRVCLFLATEDSSFITGQGIEVDGGASLDY